MSDAPVERLRTALLDLLSALEAKRAIWRTSMSESKRDRMLASNDQHFANTEAAARVALDAWNRRTSSPRGEEVEGPSIDTGDYDRDFYGILNAYGDFWTPLVFDGEDAARQHVIDFWADNTEGRDECLATFKFIPVRIRLTALEVQP